MAEPSAGAPLLAVENLRVRFHTRTRIVEAVRGIGFTVGREKLGIVAELWAFMKVRKKWWLGPIVVMLALLGLLIVFTQGSAVAPFIYTLF